MATSTEKPSPRQTAEHRARVRKEVEARVKASTPEHRARLEVASKRIKSMLHAVPNGE